MHEIDNKHRIRVESQWAELLNEGILANLEVRGKIKLRLYYSPLLALTRMASANY